MGKDHNGWAEGSARPSGCHPPLLAALTHTPPLCSYCGLGELVRPARPLPRVSTDLANHSTCQGHSSHPPGSLLLNKCVPETPSRGPLGHGPDPQPFCPNSDRHAVHAVTLPSPRSLELLIPDSLLHSSSQALKAPFQTATGETIKRNDFSSPRLQGGVSFLLWGDLHRRHHT